MYQGQQSSCASQSMGCWHVPFLVFFFFFWATSGDDSGHYFLGGPPVSPIGGSIITHVHSMSHQKEKSTPM